MLVSNLIRYEDYPRFAEDGRVIENYLPTHEGRLVKFEDIKELLEQAFRDGHSAGYVHCPINLAFSEWKRRNKL